MADGAACWWSDLVSLTLSGREACDRTLAERTGRPFKRAFFHADALHSASRATMAAAAEQSAAEMKRIDGPMCVIEGLVRCPLTLLLPQATRHLGRTPIWDPVGR
jgi:hypothetical protein